jgi:peptide/nickel transport system substrate-binding protein
MEDSTFLPLVNDKSLLYRNPEVTNVFYSAAYSMYDYLNLGIDTSKK